MINVTECSKEMTLISREFIKNGKIYQVEKYNQFQRNAIRQIYTKTLPEQVEKFLLDQKLISETQLKDQWELKGSIGQGKFAEIPWVSILKKTIAPVMTEGFYIVFLTASDGNKVYLSLNQGFEGFKWDRTQGSKLSQIKKVSKNLKKYLENKIDIKNGLEELDLKAKTERGKGYQAANILAFEITDDKSLSESLDMCIRCIKVIEKIMNHRNIQNFINSLLLNDIEIYEELELPNANSEENYQNSIQDALLINQKNISEYKPKDFNNSSKKITYSNKFKRDPKVAAQALVNSNFECQFDKNHMSFTSDRTKKRYVEAHHFIPISKQSDFNYSLDNEANVIGLCANCHKLIHHAIWEEKRGILSLLFNKINNNLNDAGLNQTKKGNIVNLEYVEQIYRLK